MDPTYDLGPDKQRWTPRSWDDVESAAASGQLDETHWVDIKEDVPEQSKGANIELARDLASLGLDGGLLVVGVEERKGNASAASVGGVAGAVKGVQRPIPLADRIEQVARSLVHPPLVVQPRIIQSSSGTGNACVIVAIGRSVDAPHMVDGRYWGRSSHGKRILSDSEVRRHFELNRGKGDDFADGLRELADEDDIVGSRNGHLYVLAKPLGSDRDALTSTLYNPEGLAGVRREMETVQDGHPESAGGYYPNFRHDLAYARDSRGVTFSSWQNAEDFRENSCIRCVVWRDGSVGLICGRATLRDDSSGRLTNVLIPSLIMGLAYSTLNFAGRLSANFASYYGTWRVGMLIERTYGVEDMGRMRSITAEPSPYNDREYLRIEGATTAELIDFPTRTVERLVRDLLLTLSCERMYLPYR